MEQLELFIYLFILYFVTKQLNSHANNQKRKCSLTVPGHILECEKSFGHKSLFMYQHVFVQQ